MFCYQCEQTAKGTGCTVAGACGKDPQTAALQDLLIYATKDISRYAYRAHQMGTRDRAVDVFTVKALFSTITNVNFDLRWFGTFLQEAAIIKGKAQSLYEKAARQAGKTPETFSCPVRWWENTDDLQGLLAKAQDVSIAKWIEKLGGTPAGLQELIVYGLKGAAAYVNHAEILGKDDPKLALLRLDPENAEIWLDASSVVAGIKLLFGADPKEDYRDNVAKVSFGTPQ